MPPREKLHKGAKVHFARLWRGKSCLSWFRNVRSICKQPEATTARLSVSGVLITADPLVFASTDRRAHPYTIRPRVLFI
ncbi:hypothetical protein Rcae01_01435 [Novipirellula caenicola]|uniref:Uncharacterized protein n=1 Tax=Novipirellula caenicola TaxID=1536901 RepID=A0ABP9VNW9_9BACT